MIAARRLKRVIVLAVLASSGLALLAWTQVWVSAHVAPAGAARVALDVTGATAAPALTALALAGIALAGALTIAGAVIRIVLGLLEILLGFSVFLAAFLAVRDPAAASASAVTAATGIAGHDAVRDGVVDASATAWPFLAIAAGVLMAAVGIAILVTTRRWPGPATRYQAVRFESADTPEAPNHGDTRRAATADAQGDAVDDWDGLSRGDDPTIAPDRAPDPGR